MEVTSTPFSMIYDSFLTKLTDDMYMELNELDTYRLLEKLLMNAVHKFEFPRFDITDYEETEVDDVGTYEGMDSDNMEVPTIIYNGGHFNSELTQEEINIIATYMVVEWLSQQLASVENTRMKASGSDFKFTSQANHMAKLTALKDHYTTEGFHLQRLYSRREKDEDGIYRTTFGKIMEESAAGRAVSE